MVTGALVATDMVTTMAIVMAIVTDIVQDIVQGIMRVAGMLITHPPPIIKGLCPPTICTITVHGESEVPEAMCTTQRRATGCRLPIVPDQAHNLQTGPMMSTLTGTAMCIASRGMIITGLTIASGPPRGKPGLQRASNLQPGKPGPQQASSPLQDPPQGKPGLQRDNNLLPDRPGHPPDNNLPPGKEHRIRVT